MELQEAKKIQNEKQLKEAKEGLYIFFEEYLKKINMTFKDFEDKYSEDYNFDDLENVLKNPKRKIPLRIINLLAKLVSKDKENEKEVSDRLLNAWYYVHIRQKRKRMDAFMDMTYLDLAWVVDNIDKLIWLSDDEILFVTFLRDINDDGMKQLEYSVKLVWNYIGYDYQENQIIQEFSEPKEYKTKLEYMVMLEENEKIWKVRGVEDRNARFEFWANFKYMNDLHKEWYELFLNLKTHQDTLSKGQTILMTVLLMLWDNKEYRS